jgi:hypothetical protein
MSLGTYFNLPDIVIPGQILDTFEADLRSKKTKLVNEKDPKGLPIFLAGNRQGTLINAYYPYPTDYIFNEQTSVALAKPAATITRNGSIRFYYVDTNGNINGGTVSSSVPLLDMKLRKNG